MLCHLGPKVLFFSLQICNKSSFEHSNIDHFIRKLLNSENRHDKAYELLIVHHFVSLLGVVLTKFTSFCWQFILLVLWVLRILITSLLYSRGQKHYRNPRLDPSDLLRSLIILPVPQRMSSTAVLYNLHPLQKVLSLQNR